MWLLGVGSLLPHGRWPGCAVFSGLLGVSIIGSYRSVFGALFQPRAWRETARLLALGGRRGEGNASPHALRLHPLLSALCPLLPVSGERASRPGPGPAGPPPHPVQRCGSPACPSTDFQTSPDAALPFPLPEVARPLFMFLGILPCESDSFGYPGAGLRRFFSFLFPAKSFTRFVHLLSSPPLWLPLLPAPCHAPLSGGRK